MRRFAFLAPWALLLAALFLSTAAVAKPKVHIVYPGQTLAMIAKRYNVSVEELCKANGIKKKSPIQPKQKLVIPSDDEPEVIPAAIRKAREPKPERSKDRPRVKKNSKSSKRKGFLVLKSYVGSWRGFAVKQGKLTPAGKKGVERVLASWRTGQHEHINDRLIRLLTKVSDHFGGRPIRVVSGYRPYVSTQYTAHSQHNSGHAVDFSIPGVSNRELRDYCRTLPNVGVGYYPNSSFVHLDARETTTYWIDYSGPGQAPRYANAKGKDPGEQGNEERDEPSSSQGDGSSSADDDDDSRVMPSDI